MEGAGRSVPPELGTKRLSIIRSMGAGRGRGKKAEDVTKKPGSPGASASLGRGKLKAVAGQAEGPSLLERRVGSPVSESSASLVQKPASVEASAPAPAKITVTPGQFDDSVTPKDQSSKTPTERLLYDLDCALQQKQLEKALICALELSLCLVRLPVDTWPSVKSQAGTLVTRLLPCCQPFLESEISGKEMILVVLGRLHPGFLDDESKALLKQWKQKYCPVSVPQPAADCIPDQALAQLINYSMLYELLLNSERMVALKNCFTEFISTYAQRLLDIQEDHEAVWGALLGTVFTHLHLMNKDESEKTKTCRGHLQTVISQVLKKKTEQGSDWISSLEAAEEYASIVRYCVERKLFPPEKQSEFERTVYEKLRGTDDPVATGKETRGEKLSKLREQMRSYQEQSNYEALLKLCLSSRRSDLKLWMWGDVEVLNLYFKQALTVEVSKLCLMASRKGLEDPDYLLQLNKLVHELRNLIARPWVSGHYPCSMLTCLWQNTVNQVLVPTVVNKVKDGSEQALNEGDVFLKKYMAMFPPGYFFTLAGQIAEAKQRLFGQQQLHLKAQQEQKDREAALAKKMVPTQQDQEEETEKQLQKEGLTAEQSVPLRYTPLESVSENHLQVFIGNRDKAREIGRGIYLGKKYQLAWSWLDFIYDYYQQKPMPYDDKKKETLAGFASNIAITVIGECFDKTKALNEAGPAIKEKGCKDLAVNIQDLILPFMQMFPQLDPHKVDEREAKGATSSFNKLCAVVRGMFLSQYFQEYKKQRDLLEKKHFQGPLDDLEASMVALLPWFDLLNLKTRKPIAKYYLQHFSCNFRVIHEDLDSTDPEMVVGTLQLIEEKIVGRYRFFIEANSCDDARRVVDHAKSVIARLEVPELDWKEEVERLKEKMNSISFPYRDE